MKVYMKTGWVKKQTQILRGILTKTLAHNFTFDFGTNDTIIPGQSDAAPHAYDT